MYGKGRINNVWILHNFDFQEKFCDWTKVVVHDGMFIESIKYDYYQLAFPVKCNDSISDFSLSSLFFIIGSVIDMSNQIRHMLDMNFVYGCVLLYM